MTAPLSNGIATQLLGTRQHFSTQNRIHPIAATASTPTIKMVSSYSPTMNGVIIGLLSSFGSAIVIALVFLVVYFFRYTTSGRIFLDRIGRPGEYDDEQAFAKEEAEALETMDDMQRTEYLRAKGKTRSASHSLMRRAGDGRPKC